MKKYYLHNGTESSGPFDIEELRQPLKTNFFKINAKKLV